MQHNVDGYYMLLKDGNLASESSSAVEKDVFAQLDSLEEDARKANVWTELDEVLFLPEFPPIDNLSLDSFVVENSGQALLEAQEHIVNTAPPITRELSSPSIKRKAIDFVTPFTLFTPENKKRVIEMRVACPLMCERIITKITSGIEPGSRVKFYNDIEMQWLGGETVEFQGKHCQITKDELNSIFTVTRKYNKVKFLNDLWDNNNTRPIIQEILTSMGQQSLYIVFKELLKIKTKVGIKKFIWGLKTFADWVLKKDAGEVAEIFITMLENGPFALGILESLWRNKQVRNTLLNTNNEKTIKLLSKELLKLSKDMMILLLAPGRPIYHLIRNKSEADAAQFIYDCGTMACITEDKLDLVVSLIDKPEVLKKVLEDIDPSQKLKSYFRFTIQKRLYNLATPERIIYVPR